MKIINTLLLVFIFIFEASSQGNSNVLFIAIDDLKPMLSCYEETQVISPNIDKLADEGAVFTNNHCQQAICGPSRASVMTGLRPNRTKVWKLWEQMREKNPNVLTIPQYFKQQGYQTYAIGKVFDPRCVDKEHDRISWTIPYKNTWSFTYDEKYGKPAGASYQRPETKRKIEQLEEEAKKKGLKGKKYQDYIKEVKPSIEAADVPDNAYADGMFAKEAQRSLIELSKQNQPFFLAVGFKKPHLPFVAPQKYWDLYKREEIKLAAFQEKAKGYNEISYHNFGELRGYSDIPKKGAVPEEKQRELIHGYMACVSYIDALIGNILNTMDSLNLTSNTIIVLWGDHGWHLGDHGLWAKHTNFEQATRSPLIIKSPQYKKTISNSSPTEFVDIFPTLCELAGLEIPHDLDGKSLLPIISGKEQRVKQFAISQFPRGKNTIGYAIRNDRYRYVEWWKGDNTVDLDFTDAKTQARELYDYEKDPQETENLIRDKKYFKIQAAMREQLRAYLGIKK